MKEFILKNVDEMRVWAREFADSLSAPVVVALHGDLGMGKSEIARAIMGAVRFTNFYRLICKIWIFTSRRRDSLQLFSFAHSKELL